MVDINNRGLAILFVFAIIISVGGTIININRINSMTEPQQGATYRSTTAMATATGNVTLNISSFAAISLNVANVSFGAGYVNGSGFCNLTTVADASTNCSGFYGANEPPAIQIENTGTQNVSIQINLSTTALTLFDTTDPNANMSLMASCNETDCCNQINSSFDGTWNADSAIAGLNPYVCGDGDDTDKVRGLDFLDGSDAMDIDVMVYFNQDAQINTTGQLNWTMDITAEGP